MQVGGDFQGRYAQYDNNVNFITERQKSDEFILQRIFLQVSTVIRKTIVPFVFAYYYDY